MYTPNVRVIQLMYRLLRGFQPSVPNVVVCVQTCRSHHYTLCNVDNVHYKFQGCTVDVQDTIGFLTISTLPSCMCTYLLLAPLHFMHCR